MTEPSLQGKGYSSKFQLSSSTAAAEEDTIKAKMLDDEPNRPASEHLAPTEAVVVRMCSNKALNVDFGAAQWQCTCSKSVCFSIFWLYATTCMMTLLLWHSCTPGWTRANCNSPFSVRRNLFWDVLKAGHSPV